MGLLVAGITGGASLIKTAQLRSVVTESETYRTAFNTYYSQVGNTPTMTSSTTAWNDLKNNNIIDKTHTSGAIASKFRGANWFIIAIAISTPAQNIAATGRVLVDFVGMNSLFVSGTSAVLNHPFVPNDAKSIDDKVDDGKALSGYVRGAQGTASATVASSFTTVEYGTGTNYSLFMKLDF